MTARPCLGCGNLIATGNRCPSCRPKDQARDTTSAHWNNNRWKNLSKRLRKAAPFCEFCGAGQHLQVDHILPISEYPELTYEVENLRVLCKRCNGTRGATYTQQEAEHVLSRLQSAYKRRPKAKYRNLIQIAQRAAQGGGIPPAAPESVASVGKLSITHDNGYQQGRRWSDARRSEGCTEG